MNLSDIASILQIGFSGFAFLLAGMSYKLLKDETSRKGSGRSTILNAIGKYSKYTLLMAIIVIISRVGEKGLDHYFTFVTHRADKERIATSTEAGNCRGALLRLINAESKINNDYKSLLLAIQQGSSNCNNVLSELESAD